MQTVTYLGYKLGNISLTNNLMSDNYADKFSEIISAGNGRESEGKTGSFLPVLRKVRIGEQVLLPVDSNESSLHIYAIK